MATQTHSDELTHREQDVMRLLAAGVGNEGIARALGISKATVKGHLESIYQKYRVHNRTAAVLEWLRRRARGAE